MCISCSEKNVSSKLNTLVKKYHVISKKTVSIYVAKCYQLEKFRVQNSFQFCISSQETKLSVMKLCCDRKEKHLEFLLSGETGCKLFSSAWFIIILGGFKRYNKSKLIHL